METSFNQATESLYAGIGARSTPLGVLKLMNTLGAHLGSQGFKLRSGAAQGADIAFEQGSDSVSGKKEIWLPWKGFDGRNQGYFPSAAHMEKASKYHPVWNQLRDGAKKLHSRNVGQVFGMDLKTPVKFVICWTPDGCEHHNSRTRQTGGTGMAISMASLSGIQVFNLANEDALCRLQKLLHYLNEDLFEKVYNPHQLDLII